MSAVYRWFSSLSPRTRIAIGGGLIAYGLAGSFLTDKAEEVFDLVPTDDDKERLKSLVPRIRAVNREDDEEIQRLKREN